MTRERERETDRQTDRQTDKQTDRQRQRQRQRETEKKIGKGVGEGRRQRWVEKDDWSGTTFSLPLLSAVPHPVMAGIARGWSGLWKQTACWRETDRKKDREGVVLGEERKQR